MNGAAAYRRARHALWACVAAAVVLTGTLGIVLRSSPGPAAGLAVAGLGLLLATVLALATRLLLALTGRLAGRPGPDEPDSIHGSHDTGP